MVHRFRGVLKVAESTVEGQLREPEATHNDRIGAVFRGSAGRTPCVRTAQGTCDSDPGELQFFAMKPRKVPKGRGESAGVDAKGLVLVCTALQFHFGHVSPG